MESKPNLGRFSPEEQPQALEQAAQTFFNYLNITDQPEEADVIFIVGGSSIKPTEKAAQLYKAGYAKKIAFVAIGGTFGGDKVWGMSEYEMYKKTLMELGIEEDAIMYSGLGTNTKVEAQKAIPFLAENNVNVKKMILVSRPIHQRRAFATFENRHPEVKYINCPANEPLDLNDLDTKKRLVAEAERILDYSKKGDLQKQEIPYAVLRTAALIRRHLRVNGEYTDRRKPKKQ